MGRIFESSTCGPFAVRPGSFISVQLRANEVLTGFLHVPPAGRRVPYRVYVRDPHGNGIFANLEAKGIDSHQNHFHANICYIRIGEHSFVSTALSNQYDENEYRGQWSVILIERINTNTNSHTNPNIITVEHYGLLARFNGSPPIWAQGNTG